MDDARDAEDKRLLAEGDHRQLVESYYGVILDRCRARVPAQDAIDVAAEVALRLLSELKRGKTYPVPFRVVVHKVIGWKIKEHFTGLPAGEIELDGDLTGGDPFEQLEGVLTFDALLDGLSELERQVLSLRWREGLEIEEIAARIGKKRNAVDQIIHRGVEKLRMELVT